MKGRRGASGAAGVRVDGYSERWLRRGFPWVYPKEVQGSVGAAGHDVLVRGPSGDALGRGLTGAGWIAVRVMRHDGGPLDDAWLGSVLDRAASHRDRALDPADDARRLVHAEDDGLPGVRIDAWGAHAVVVLDDVGLLPLLPGIRSWLGARGFASAWRCARRDPREGEGVALPDPGVLLGDPPDEVMVTELGLHYLVRPREGPDVGLYPDMRDVRRWLRPHLAGRRVLNTFAYTGAFSVLAAASGAAEVVTCDLSAKVLDRARANLVANGLDAGEILAEDTFRVLDRFRRQGRQFDLVVLDPPSFSHSDAGVWSAKKDYPRLVAAACRVLAPDGWFLCASNQGVLSPKEFRQAVADGVRKAGAGAQEIHWASQAPDYPASVTFPEGRYLKVGVWRVV